MTLQVNLKAKDMEITPQLEEFVRKKVTKLDRYLDNLQEAHVELTYVKSARSASDRQVAQVTVRGPSILLRAEERSEDMFASIDTAVDKVQRRLEREKGRRYRGRGDGTSASQVAVLPAEASEASSREPVIARRKKFELVPMDEREAIEQMQRLGHESFFVFLNLRTEQINVLYLRRDGTYGLIEPVPR